MGSGDWGLAGTARRTWAAVTAAAVVALAGALSLAAPSLGAATGLAKAASSTTAICGSLPIGSPLPDGTALTAEQSANAEVLVALAFERRCRPSRRRGRGRRLLRHRRPRWGPGQLRPGVPHRPHGRPRMAGPTDRHRGSRRHRHPGRLRDLGGPASQLVAGLSGAGPCGLGGGPAATTTTAGGWAVLPMPGAATTLPAGYAVPAGTPAPAAGAVSFAIAQLGKPYLWGATGPGAYDCSGLVQAAYASVGIALPRTTYDQVYAGEAVYGPWGPAGLAPGDLLFSEGDDPGPGGLPGHVAMYIGEGLVIDAPQTGYPVEVTGLAAWAGLLVAVRRVVG